MPAAKKPAETVAPVTATVPLTELTELQMRAMLAQKVMMVIDAVSNIEKTGHNKHFNYKFVEETEVLRCVRKALTDAKLVVLPSIPVYDTSAWHDTGGGKPQTVTAIQPVFHMIDAETGYQIDLPWIGHASDTDDKAPWKAITGSVKYFLSKAFLIPTGDDPEHDRDKQTPAPARAKVPPDNTHKKLLAADMTALGIGNPEAEPYKSMSLLADINITDWSLVTPPIAAKIQKSLAFIVASLAGSGYTAEDFMSWVRTKELVLTDIASINGAVEAYSEEMAFLQDGEDEQEEFEGYDDQLDL